MPFELARFLEVRPFAFHVTARHHVARLRKTRIVESSASLLLAAGLTGGVRRGTHREILIGEERVHLRDQARLIEGNIDFEPGWNMPRFVKHLDHHVYFWPGLDNGLRDRGRGFFDRYRRGGEALAVIRIATAALMELNPKPLFSRYNSGAPRQHGGAASPRGGGTFQHAAKFQGTAGDVVELVFEREARLPDNATWATSLDVEWQRL